jgi:hypothetical protein
MIPALITFKWKPKGDYRSQYTSEHVNMHYRGFKRFYPKMRRYICITDDPKGLDPDIETYPLWTEGSGLSNPTWPDGPACYPRLFVWSETFARLLNLERFAVLDIDMVPVAPQDAIFDRTEPLLVWRTGQQRIPLCASMLMMNAGTQAFVWEEFIRNPAGAIELAQRQGYRGSDQAWITYCVGTNCKGWSTEDGVHEYSRLIPPRPPGHNSPRRKRHVHRHLAMPSSIQNRIPRFPNREAVRPAPPPRREYGAPGVGPLPKGARTIIFTGTPDPWDEEALTMSPWIREYLWPKS